MIRLYFNTHGDKPWSVDAGPGTPEKTFAVVHVRVPGVAVYDGTLRGSQVAPCAWIEFENCRLRELLNCAEILPG